MVQDILGRYPDLLVRLLVSNQPIGRNPRSLKM